MKNIFKSYMKAFVKAWVETLGTIAFLMIFTMLIFGMLATPLQLSLKATSVKKETNLWQTQWNSRGWFDDEFIYEYAWNGKEVKFNYEGMEFNLAVPELNSDENNKSWFTPEAIKLVKDYVDNEFKDQTESPELIELKKQETIRAISSLIWMYYSNGDDVTTKRFNINSTDEVEGFSVGKIFTNNAKKILSEVGVNNSNNRSLYNYVIYSILDQLEKQSNGSFKYENFANANFKMMKNSKESYVYNISSATSLSNDDKLNINNIVLQKGRLPEENNEIVVSDAFLKNQKKAIGDKILLGVDQLYEGGKNLNTKEFTIVGIGLKYSTLTPINFSSFTDSIKDYGQIFMKNTFFIENKAKDGYSFKEIFQPDDWKMQATTGFSLAYKVETFISKNDKNYNLNSIFSSKNINAINVIRENEQISIVPPGSVLFKDIKDYSVINSLTNLYIITWIYLAIGSILFVLGFMFILFVLKKEINNTRRQLGVFKSLGYKTSELTWVFSLKTFLTMFIGIGIGYLLSFPFQIDSATKQFSTFVIFDYNVIYASPIFLFVLILIVPILFSILSYLIIFKFLNEGALSLLTNGPKKGKSDYIVLILKIIFFPALIYSLVNWIILKILRSRNKGFTFRMQEAFVSAGKGKFVIIMGLFIFSSFLFTLQLRAMPIIKNMIEGGYNIYAKDVNHYYGFKTVVPIKTRNGTISEDSTKEKYNINYNNIGDKNIVDFVKTSTEDKYKTTNNFSKLMTNLSSFRDSYINQSEETVLALSAASSISAVITPLTNLPTNIKSDINIPSIEDIPKDSLWNITPEDMSGIFIDDIGKFACISPLSVGYKGSCNDVESYKKYLDDNLEKILTPGQQTRKNQINFNSNFITLISTFAKMKEGINSLLSVNEILFNGNIEALQTTLSYHIENNTDIDSESSLVRLIDASGKFGGDARSVVNFDSLTDSLMNQLQEKNHEYVNSVISYRLAMLLNKQVGDIFDIVIGKDVNLKVRVAAINGNDTLLQDIYADYTVVMDKVGTKETKDNQKYLFNSIISKKVASEGTIDLKDIAKSRKNFYYSRDTYTIASSENKPWLASIMVPNIIIGDKTISPQKPDASNFFMDSSVITLPILKSVINQVLGKMTNAMLMYIIIDVVLLIILLVVIMNIIITDSINVITIMRSLGYTNGQINWMVMGKYVTGAAISYIFAFITSLVVWKGIQMFVWERFKVLIALPTLPWIPFVSAIILGAILYIGWTAAMLQIKKRPLTLLVS
ncbi:ABC transporter permease [Spiroplasma diminutum]|uniref:ABC transporter permease n=1 Tax=Spiroplasma diminutum CUAS-1 TaxID=1276221 RepID=S5LX40_9MOLU|nr:ABC transporter permease [Spiroplasma diminutum]AGR42384.1 ABC transporter permease [Spiroplasma diminutum CUAS-1]